MKHSQRLEKMMNKLGSAQQIAETTLRAITLFPLQGDKVDFVQERLKEIANLPQLTIPQSVADVLDKRWEAQNKYLQRKVTVPRDAFYNAVNPYDNQLAATKIGEWIDENQSICFAYLSGKALKVDLVQVVKE